MKRISLIAVTAMVAALLLPVAPASAATVYTWVAGWTSTGDPVPGADHKYWENPLNWQPQGIPGPADSVILTNAPATFGVQSATELTVPASGASVAALTIEEPGAGTVRLFGTSALTVTGTFAWTGGEVYAPLVISAGGTGRIGAGPLKPLHAKMTVNGQLTLDNIGTSVDTDLQLYPDYAGDNDGITVSRGGRLTAKGANLVNGTGCCTDPARIVNRGTFAVSSGRTTLTALQFEQYGTLAVARTARLTHTTGTARLGAGAKYTGGGTVEFKDTASIVASPKGAAVPGGILLRGTGSMASGTRLLFGAGAKVTGVGGFTGKGLIDFSATRNTGGQAATLYGDLSIGATTALRFGGAHPARMSVFNPKLAGYHGVLRIRGNATLVARATFVPAAGTTTTVVKGGQLTLQPGSTFGGGDCCIQQARLTIAQGATLRVPQGKQAAATLLRVKLVLKGTMKPAAGKLVTRR